MPFANDLGEGANAGQAEIDALTSAGFSVDVYRNGEVTPDLLTHLADYSVVYLETHSTTLGDGDAILDTASTDNKKYVSYIKDGTVLQATAAGVSGLFLAITSQFILKHVGIFEPSTLLYFDGCDLLPATVFWSALESKGVGALVSWDSHVYSGASQNASQFMFGQFAHGESVATSIAAAESAGLANALGDKGIAHLGYLGDGDDTLARALAHYTAPPTATPTPTDTPSVTDTPTPTPTDIPTATPTPVTKKACPRNASKKHGKCTCKKGYKMVHGKCKKVKKKK